MNSGQYPLKLWLEQLAGSPEVQESADKSPIPSISLDRLNIFDVAAALQLGQDSTGAPKFAQIEQMALTASDLYWNGGEEARAHLEGFQVSANPWGKLSELRGFIFMNPDAIEWNDAQFAFRGASWKGSISLPRAHLAGDVADVEIWLQTDEATFSNDLFTPFITNEFPEFSARMSGVISGSLNSGLVWESALLEVDSTLQLKGRFYWSENAWGGNHMQWRLAPRWLAFVKDKLDDSSYASLKKLNEITAKGELEVQGDAGAIDATLRTASGSADVMLNWSGLMNLDSARYRGRVSLVDVQLGHLLNDSKLGRVGFSLQVDGQGLTLESFDFALEGVLNEFNYNDFVITGARLDGRAREESFTGHVSMLNEWVQATYNGSLGWDSVRPYLNSSLEIQRLDLVELGWDYEDSIAVLSATFNTDLVFGPDGFPEGEMSIRNLDLETSEDYHHLDSLNFTAHSEGDSASVRIASAWFSLDVDGRFRWYEVPLALNNWYRGQFGLMGTTRPQGAQGWTAQGELIDVEPITRVILPQLQIEPQSDFRIAFDESLEQLNFQLKSDGIAWGDFRLSGLDINLETDPLTRLLKGSLYTDSTDLAGFRKWHYATYKVEVSSDTLFNTITWLDAEKTIQKGRLNTYFTLDSSTSILGWKQSDLDLVGRAWAFRPGSLRMGPEGLYLSQFNFYSGEESILAEGWIQSQMGPLQLQTHNLDLNWINLITKSRYGIYDGSLNMNINLYKGPTQSYALGTLQVDSLVWNHVHTGDLSVRMDWEEELEAIAIVADWTRSDHRYLYGAGAYYPTSPSQRVNLQLQLDSFDLRPLNPYTYHFMREIQGGLSGALFAQLDYGKPQITGDLGLVGAQFLLPITKIKYALDQNHRVIFNPEEIRLDSLIITDIRYGTKAIAQGSFRHRNLEDWKIQLHLDADSLFSLNTTRYDEDAYYGRAFATGTFDLAGTPLALTMDLDARTNKGTSFHIPLSTASEVGQARFISFRPPPTSLLESVDLEKERNKTTDIDMRFRIEATPDAAIELIFDPTVGDAIRARGAGELVMDMDREGAIDLWGSYTLKEGDYLFTLQNLINKKFIIQPGGTLTWEGDPYNAKMNMVARYPLRTSLNPLQISDTSRTKQRVLLDLGLSAELLQPKLNFDVRVPDAPTAIQEEVNAVLQSDQNEMNRQVFALLIMNSFLTPEYANRSAGTDFLNEGLTANTTEVLSNQLSRWVSQIDDRIDLGVNYQSGGVYEEQQIEVALSTQLFNDRVALNGNLGVPIGQEHTSTIVGDVEVEVLLSQDGQFRARAFNRSTQFDPLVSQYQYRQGVGVVFGTAFNSMNELREKLFGGKKE